MEKHKQNIVAVITNEEYSMWNTHFQFSLCTIRLSTAASSRQTWISIAVIEAHWIDYPQFRLYENERVAFMVLIIFIGWGFTKLAKTFTDLERLKPTEILKMTGQYSFFNGYFPPKEIFAPHWVYGTRDTGVIFYFWKNQKNEMEWDWDIDWELGFGILGFIEKESSLHPRSSIALGSLQTINDTRCNKSKLSWKKMKYSKRDRWLTQWKQTMCPPQFVLSSVFST